MSLFPNTVVRKTNQKAVLDQSSKQRTFCSERIRRTTEISILGSTFICSKEECQLTYVKSDIRTN